MNSSEQSEPSGQVRTAPAGFVAVQDPWADDFLISSSPLAPGSSVAAPPSPSAQAPSARFGAGTALALMLIAAGVAVVLVMLILA